MVTIIDELAIGRCKQDTLIEDKTFNGEVFNNFAINPIDGVEVKFKNCTFNDCRILKGHFQLGKGVTLDGVVFKNIKASGELDIHSGVKVINSKFISSDATDMLWFKNVMGDSGCNTNMIELDVSCFDGDLIITGNDVSHVKLNPKSQVFIYASLLGQERFKLNRANFFRSSASKVKNNGGKVGVFSLPKNKINTREFNTQLEYFEYNGYVSRKYITQ